jgi:hypothetical protein
VACCKLYAPSVERPADKTLRPRRQFTVRSFLLPFQIFIDCAASAVAAPASKGTRVLDPEEIKLLMKQGEQFIAAGDVVTARTVFQRAAEAGNANAAIALGATYDPNVLARLGVVGVSADLEKAQSWYQKAENLGSSEARGRLDVPADR